MYYRIAIQVEDAPAWKWKSSILGSFELLVQWLRYYRILPVARLRIFVATSAGALYTSLVPAEGQALWATSVPASQFLRERRLATSVHEANTAPTYGPPAETFVAADISATGIPTPAVQTSGSIPLQSALDICRPALERRRIELEMGSGGDHDCPYHFSHVLCLPQLHAWVQLQERVQHGDLRL
jgi:hypothetical protein